jgi:peptide/nickel transport system substrate-binding protein
MRLRNAGRVGTVIVAATSVVGLSACSGSSSSSATSAHSTSFIVGAGGIDNLDPVQFKTVAAYTVDANVYASLLKQKFVPHNGYLKGTTDTKPSLAKSVSTSADGKTVTFTLRNGLKFANGDPITADDVVYSLKRALSDAGYTSALAPYMGIKDGSAVSAASASTVQIKLAHPSALIKRFIAFQVFGVLDKSKAMAHKGSGKWATDYFSQHATSSGPYKIASREKGKQITLKQNPNYYAAGDVKASSVTIKNIPNANQQYLALKNGAIDVALGLTPELVAKAKKNPNLKVYDLPTSYIHYLGMNNKDKVLSNTLVRRAISYAIPYHALTSKVMHGFARTAYGPVSAGMPTAINKAGTKLAYPTDITKAKELLAKAGVKNLHLTLSVRASNGSAVKSATFIQSALAKIGIGVHINKLTDPKYDTKLNHKQLQMFIASWYSWGNDPFYQMDFLLHCGSATNAANYCNDKVDKDIEQGIVTTNHAKRVSLSHDAQKRVIADAPWAFLYTSDVLIATRKGVAGITDANDNYVRFAYLTRK